MPDEKVIDLDRLSRFHDNLKSNGLPLNNWQANKKYKVGYTVLQDGKLYRCKTEHTSTTTFDATKFTEISASGAGGISVWASNTQYAVNDVVIDSNLIWQCSTAHTSTTTFDESKWICLSGGEISNGLEVLPLWEGSFSFLILHKVLYLPNLK